MTTATATKTNRGWLLRQAKAGNLWVKCSYHLTDDYAYDNAVNCGRMSEFKAVYVREPHVSPLYEQIDAIYDAAYPKMPNPAILNPLTEELRFQQFAHDDAQRTKANSRIILTERDFKTKSGHIYGDKKSGSFAIHGNLNYAYEVR